MTETTEQVVERLAAAILHKCVAPSPENQFWLDMVKLKRLLREALRVGREQAAKEALAAIHNCVVNDREYFLNAIRNLSTEE